MISSLLVKRIPLQIFIYLDVVFKLVVLFILVTKPTYVFLRVPLHWITRPTVVACTANAVACFTALSSWTVIISISVTGKAIVIAGRSASGRLLVVAGRSASGRLLVIAGRSASGRLLVVAGGSASARAMFVISSAAMSRVSLVVRSRVTVVVSSLAMCRVTVVVSSLAMLRVTVVVRVAARGRMTVVLSVAALGRVTVVVRVAARGRMTVVLRVAALGRMTVAFSSVALGCVQWFALVCCGLLALLRGRSLPRRGRFTGGGEYGEAVIGRVMEPLTENVKKMRNHRLKRRKQVNLARMSKERRQSMTMLDRDTTMEEHKVSVSKSVFGSIVRIII